MQWWCAAVGVDWSWEWRAYPGVWLFILAVASIATWLFKQRESGPGRSVDIRRRPPASGYRCHGRPARTPRRR